MGTTTAEPVEGVVVSSATSRRELGRFLRTRRERVTPAEVGLRAGPRRRTTGLRREEVAVLAGLSPTWYTFLEQGRDIHPSTEVLDSLARVLRLDEDERRYLHTMARGTVHKHLPLAGEVSAADIVRLLVLTAEASAYPVYAVDLYCDLIAWNSAATVFYTDFARMPRDRRNMMRWLLEVREARERLADWEEDVRDVVARWRAMVADHDRDDRLDGLIAEFSALSPDFGRWWDGHDVREHRSRVRRFRLAELQETTMRLIVVQAPEFAPSVVVFHAPVHAPDDTFEP